MSGLVNKLIIIIILVRVIFLSFFSFGESMEEVNELISIRGMTCHSCVRNIQTNLKQLTGITSIDVSLEKQQGSVTYRPNEISMETILNEIDQLGFQASRLVHGETLVDVELGGISDENIPIATERLATIHGVTHVQFPLKNDSSHVQIAYDPTKTSAYSIYQTIHSIGYRVQAKPENIVRAYLRVQGMHCNSCVMNITQTVEDLPGIHHIKVSFDDQSANILFDSTIIPLTEIVQEIEKLDFQVAIAENNEEKSRSILSGKWQS